MKKIVFLSLSLIFLLTSCASKYNLLSPETSSFNASSKEDGLELSYDYVPLRKKYAKKAYKTGVKVAAVKIKNSSLKSMTYGEDFKFTTASGDYLEIMHPNEVYTTLKQKPGTHFLYLLLAPLQLQKTTTENGFTTTENIFPIGLILGPAISLGNFFTAKGANTKFEGEMNNYSIHNATIDTNETKTFLVALRSSNYPNLKIKSIK